MDEKETKTKKTTSTKKKTSTTKKTTTKKTTTKKATPKKEVKVVEEKVIEPVPEEVKEEPIQEEVYDGASVGEKLGEVEEPAEQVLEEAKEAIKEPVKDLVNGDFNKKPSNWIYAIVIVFILLMIGVCLYARFMPKPVTREGSFIWMGNTHERIIDNDYEVLETREELLGFFPDANTRALDFDRYQYILLSVMFDSCSERDLTPVDYAIEKSIIVVKFDYTASCGVCAPDYLYYVLEIEKDAVYEDVEIDYHATNNPHCDPNVAYKPILYFYPEEETEISVKLGNASYLTTTYPKYENGWNYIAQPDGTLKDKNTNREYYGLFWEGNQHKTAMKEDGFVVKGEDVLSFLEEKLATLGLTDREANEFIIYWLPLLENNAYNYIRFETKEEIEEYMPLEVQPKPDTVIRIQMDYKPLLEKISVQEQKLESPNRLGFTVVEWGGSIIQ